MIRTRKTKLPDLPDAPLMVPVSSKTVGVALAVASGGVDTPEWRLELADKIASGDIVVRYPQCDMSKLRHLEPISKNSASLTGIILATHDNGNEPPRDIVFKASFGLTTKRLPQKKYSMRNGFEYDNSLPIERLNYEYVANSMIRKRWSPNVASYVAAFQCTPSDLRVPTDEKLKILYNTMYASDHKSCVSVKCAVEKERDNLIFDLNRVNVLMTERMYGQKLESWIQKRHSLKEWKSVLFQILYTLECFNRIGFRHNDLHLGNIFIEDIPDAPEFTLYSITERTIKGRTCMKVHTRGHEVRIYDFDRSTLSCEKTSNYADIVIPYIQKMAEMSGGTVKSCMNTRLRFHCEREGACEEKNQKFDAFTVLGLLWASTSTNFKYISKQCMENDSEGGLFDGGKLPKKVIEFIEIHLNRGGAYNPLKIMWNWPYRAVKVEKVDGVYVASSGNYEFPDKIMSPVIEMLRDTSFFNFETVKSDNLFYQLPVKRI